MINIPKINRGDVITAEYLNKIVDGIREVQIQSVVGGFFKRGSGGTTLIIPKQKLVASATSSGSQVCPFDVTATSTTSSISLSIQPGLVNGVLPSNMFNTFTTTTSGVKFVCVDVTTNGKNVSSAEISIKTSAPSGQTATINSAPTSASIIVSVVSGGTAYKTIACGNISMRVSPSITEDNLSASGGQRNYSQYYQWVF